jgi:hypothetical protein
VYIQGGALYTYLNPMCRKARMSAQHALLRISETAVAVAAPIDAKAWQACIAAPLIARESLVLQVTIRVCLPVRNPGTKEVLVNPTYGKPGMSHEKALRTAMLLIRCLSVVSVAAWRVSMGFDRPRPSSPRASRDISLIKASQSSPVLA